VRGLVVNLGIVGILSGVGLFLLGVPYALLLAIVAALLQIIPFFGPYIAGAIALLVALPNGGWLLALEVLVLFVAIQQLEMLAIVPLVMRRAVKLNPLLTIVALLVGAAVLGLLGAVLAVPLAIVLQVLTVRVIAPIIRHQLRRGEQGDTGNTAATAGESGVVGAEAGVAPLPAT
jgi:predicted PurR-regulated permease PerM